MEVTKSEVIQIIKNAGIAGDVDALVHDHDAILGENGIDSLDMANILLLMEEKYNITIKDEHIPKLQTINAMVEYLANK